MKHKLSFVLVVGVVAAVLFAGGSSAQSPVTKGQAGATVFAAEAVVPIPNDGPTVLPVYTGAPWKAHPLPPSQAPQNPYFAANPFSNYHNDTWMSDTFDIPGPLGRSPAIFSSTFTEARTPPVTSRGFMCGTVAFDSHGRIATICQSSEEGVIILADPDSLVTLASLVLPSLANVEQRLGAGYMMLDNQDRVWTPQGSHLVAVRETGDAEQPGLALDKDYDLSALVLPGDAIGSAVPDWQGRMWFVVRSAGVVGVLDPETGTVQSLQLGAGERIANSFSVDGVDAYIVSTAKLYRLTAGADNVPRVVWSAGYKNDYTVTPKPGQISTGSGTTPTILDHGKYVAIADNATQTHVVVYRTAEKLGPKEDRMVCEQPVFEPGLGAVEDSLVGSGRSLIASNNYGYVFDKSTLISPPTQAGVARVDIDPNGKGCTNVWTNYDVNPASYGAKLSTKTGLVFLVSRKSDMTKVDAKHPYGLDVWYWTTIDFRTGKTVWERMAGTGPGFDGYWPLGFIGPNGAFYEGGYMGIFALRDSG